MEQDDNKLIVHLKLCLLKNIKQNVKFRYIMFINID